MVSSKEPQHFKAILGSTRASEETQRGPQRKVMVSVDVWVRWEEAEPSHTNPGTKAVHPLTPPTHPTPSSSGILDLGR